MTAIPKNAQKKYSGLFLIPELQSHNSKSHNRNGHPGSLRRVSDLRLQEKLMDLNDYLVRNPSDTFLIRVNGKSMKNAGIDNGDLLLVDRSLKPENKNIVVASVNRHIVVKRLSMNGDGITLKSENEGYDDIHISGSDSLEIWGVVTSVVKNFS